MDTKPLAQKLKTEYVVTEDRFRLSGETVEGNGIRLWLSQRLLLRVIPGLLDWLDEKPSLGAREITSSPESRQMMHLFAQLSAQQQLSSNHAVDSSPPSTANATLVTSVEIGKSEKHIRLAFHDKTTELIVLTLDGPQLRQWLATLHRLWCAAAWPDHIWPAWVRPAAPAGEDERRFMH